jgi:CNT family concentrative nucleoside transporter
VLTSVQLGIWIPSVVREQTRHYWIITSIIAWFFILVILFHKSKYIPKKPFSNAIGKAWGSTVERVWHMLPYYGKLGVGWGSVAVLFLGSTFGIKQTESSPYKWRVVSLVGMAFMYGVCWIMSSKRRAVRAQPIILGLCMQMIFGLLVFKTGAGLAVITWLALAASDLLESGIQGELRESRPTLGTC